MRGARAFIDNGMLTEAQDNGDIGDMSSEAFEGREVWIHWGEDRWLNKHEEYEGNTQLHTSLSRDHICHCLGPTAMRL